jgi:hypothetical protein
MRTIVEMVVSALTELFKHSATGLPVKLAHPSQVAGDLHKIAGHQAFTGFV